MYMPQKPERTHAMSVLTNPSGCAIARARARAAMRMACVRVCDGDGVCPRACVCIYARRHPQRRSMGRAREPQQLRAFVRARSYDGAGDREQPPRVCPRARANAQHARAPVRSCGGRVRGGEGRGRGGAGRSGAEARPGRGGGPAAESARRPKLGAQARLSVPRWVDWVAPTPVQGAWAKGRGSIMRSCWFESYLEQCYSCCGDALVVRPSTPWLSNKLAGGFDSMESARGLRCVRAPGSRSPCCCVRKRRTAQLMSAGVRRRQRRQPMC